MQCEGIDRLEAQPGDGRLASAAVRSSEQMSKPRLAKDSGGRSVEGCKHQWRLHFQGSVLDCIVEKLSNCKIYRALFQMCDENLVCIDRSLLFGRDRSRLYRS